MLIKHRADFGVIGLQTYAYYQRMTPAFKNSLHVMDGYDKPFSRGILVSKADLNVQQDINAWLHSDQWLTLQEKWLAVHVKSSDL